MLIILCMSFQQHLMKSELFVPFWKVAKLLALIIVLLNQKKQLSVILLSHCVISSIIPIHGEFPSRLKIAKVTPIYKSEDGSKVNNYRPISVLPISSEILKIMCYRLLDFISINNLLCTNQLASEKRTQHLWQF